MCGIFCMLNGGAIGEEKLKEIKSTFDKGSGRGPEKSTLVIRDDIVFGFHRLAINGFTNDSSGQPMHKHNCTLICNGEIYNWRHLIEMSGSDCKTGSDCEVIIDLYKKYGIANTLHLLDGVFAFILVDHDNKKMYVARDGIGIRPLFMWYNNVYLDCILFASELKMAPETFKTRMPPKAFPPGHYMTISYKEYGHDCRDIKPFFTNEVFENHAIKKISQTDELIRSSLKQAVEKRVDNTEREIACLLSGGLDSSLICSLVVNIYKEKHGKDGAKMVNTWSIGLEGSEDLKYAKQVAEFLGTTHHEVKCTEEEFLNAIPEVIYAIESKDTTTVRASVGNYLICKYIKENSSAKVIFNGDGSDELTGGYLFFHYAPGSIEFDIECKRLLKDLHLFDVLRSDRSISSHGLEARTPFLDRGFIQSYLSIPSHIRNHCNGSKPEKYLLRHAFKNGYLPDNVLWRRKEAFSDGVSTEKESWFEVIQRHTHLIYPDMEKKGSEQRYYDDIFHSHFGDESYTKNIMPYKWMPKFIEATDASARTLPIYNK